MTSELLRLQGVWFPTHIAVRGELISANDPAFPDTGNVPLMTIHGEHYHFTSSSMGYWSGGRLILTEMPRQMTFDYAGLPEEFCSSPVDYQLGDDELLLCWRKTPLSKHWEDEQTARYARVATKPTPEMVSLFESVMREGLWANWDWESRTYKRS